MSNFFKFLHYLKILNTIIFHLILHSELFPKFQQFRVWNLQVNNVCGSLWFVFCKSEYSILSFRDVSILVLKVSIHNAALWITFAVPRESHGMKFFSCITSN